MAALEHKEYDIENNEENMARTVKKKNELIGQCTATATTLTNQEAELKAELAAIDRAIDAISAAYGDDAVSS
jgi:hypothetical protein